MSMVFYTALSLSITGSAFALLLFALKPVYKRGFSKVWQYYIWFIVLARLLIPFSPETNLFNMVFKDAPSFSYEEQPVLVPPTEQAADADTDDEENTRPNAIPQDVVEPESVDIPSNPSVSFTAQDWLMYARYLWAAGALGLFIWKLSSYLRLVRQLQRGSKFCSDPRVASYMDAICASMKISPAPVVYISEAVPTPMLIGIWRQSMILPNDALGKDDLKHVLQHELVHYRRYDILYKWLAQIAVCVHWFNPLVYLVRREISRNCELACDEVIIRGADDQERKNYGEAIIEAIKPGAAHLAHSGMSVSMSEDTKIIKERLDAIMKYKNTPKIVALLSIFMAAIIMCGAAFAGSFTGANVDGSTNTSQVASLDNTQSKDTESTASTPGENSRTVLYNGEAVSGLNIEANSIGLEIIKTTGDAFIFEYLNVDNEDLVSASASMGQNSVLDICVINSGTLSYTNSDPGNYRNVVRINVPEASYSQVTMNLEQAPTTMQDLSSNINITGNRGGVEIKSATISGNYTINNASGGVEFTANEILGNITVTNNGEVIVTLASQPTNLSLDATGSSGEIILPSGWSRTHTIGNGAPSIVINNRGFTKFSIGTTTVNYNLQSSVEELSINTNKDADIADKYELYRQYGLTYDSAQDKMFYDGKVVRYFVDRYNNGNGVRVMWAYDLTGTIDLYAVRNNATDQGELTGIAQYTQEEFNLRTLEIEAKQNNNPNFDVLTFRFRKNEAPDSLLLWIQECENSPLDFHVTDQGGRYYVYVRGDTNFGFSGNVSDGNTRMIMDVYAIDGQSDGYALFSVPLYDRFTVSYNEEAKTFIR